MMTDPSVLVVGGGIVGTATGMALAAARPDLRLILVEAEPRLAVHQTGHNSGVIHSGIAYRPGSRKARDCVLGRDALYRHCVEYDIPHERCGKLVVATEPDELPRLHELATRAEANGLRGVRVLEPEAIREHEPAVTGLAGLWIPETGIVDYAAVTASFAAVIRAAGGEIRTATRFQSAAIHGDEIVADTTGGPIRASLLVNCGGLQADRVARRSGLFPDVRIIPFRGEYWDLVPDRRMLIRNLVYPVADPRYPFLGVHFTRMLDGSVKAGPNALLALKREGYTRASCSARDVASILGWPGFWRLARRHAGTGAAELWRSLSRGALVRALRRMLPELASRDLVRSGSGVRAQAVARDGRLLDDFHIQEAERAIHVLNAPSPAATASIAIGRAIADLASTRLPRS